MKRKRFAQVRRVFLEACRLEESDRQPFLQRIGTEDPALRDEVESLLKHHDRHTLLEDTPAYDGRATTQPGFLSSDHVASSGRFLQGRRASSLARSRPRLAERRRLAFISATAALLLLALGYWVYAGIDGSLRSMRANKLQALLNNQILALRFWIRQEMAKVESWARNRALVTDVERLLEFDADAPGARTRYAEAAERVRIRELLQATADHDLTYAVWDTRGVMIANDFPVPDHLATRIATAAGKTFFRVLEGQTVFIRPSAENRLVREARRIDDHPVVAVLTPVRDRREKIIAVLGVADTASEDMFSAILATAQTGETGETYAFDRHGLMLTESRFKQQLKACGLIPDTPDARSSTVVYLRDPGGDLTAGFRPSTPLDARPLTLMARLATAGKDGIDLDGYRDYRGVPVIGAWRWLPEYDFGVATEIDRREAYAPLRYLRVAFGLVFTLLTIAVAGVLISSYRIGALTRQVGEARKLGQYTLEEKIGEGGMGVVYRARHAMLRRPTAVKLLKPELMTPETVARFEREVQLASRLTHPNTIEIYDYGRTPEGVFYYAMEYLPGITLERLVDLERAVPPARCVHILRQICQSLAEAHHIGLVHRDIKPLNVMLCRRGGMDDVVKVLDFGLVKQIDPDEGSDLTQSRQVSGTPLYIAPERLEDPTGLDTRSDIFSLGALAFKLLTGEDAFRGRSPVDLFYQLTQAPRPRPRDHAATPVPELLDQLVVDCLAKDPADRPQTVLAILDRLDRLDGTDRWTAEDAHRWWDARPELLE